MLAVQKLAKEALKHRNESCASYILVNDVRHNAALKKLVEMRVLEAPAEHASGRGGAEVLHENYHAFPFLSEACFARLSGLRMWYPFKTPAGVSVTNRGTLEDAFRRAKKPFPKYFKAMLSAVSDHTPHYMVWLVRNQLRNESGNLPVKKDGVEINWEGLRKKEYFQRLERGYNALMEACPWATSTFIGKEHTLQNHMENGAIMKVSKDHTLQRVFATGMLLRMPMEHHTRFTATFAKLESLGFDAKTSAYLSLYIIWEGPDFALYRGSGHDWVNNDYANEKVYVNIAKGIFEPCWTQDQSWNEGSRFDLFLATQYSTKQETTLGVGEFRIPRGDGWNKKWVFNIHKFKEVYDAHRN